MPTFTHKPTRVVAKQFTGGEKNAKQLTSWLKAKDIKAVWFKPMKTDNLELPEEFHIWSSDGLVIAIKGKMIVVKEDNTVVALSADVIERDYILSE